MNLKLIEIEAIVEDLIDNIILEALCDSFETKEESAAALEMLKEKLDDVEPSVFDEIYE